MLNSPAVPDASSTTPINPFGLLPDELLAAVAATGLPRFRGDQVRQWLYQKLAPSPAEMTNLAAADRERLSAAFDFEPGRIVKQQDSADGTRKLLIEWKRDGWPEPATTECVMIPDHDRRTACVSSQVGCPVGCKFCASGIERPQGQSGPRAKLCFRSSRPEIACSPTQDGSRITNIVFMGMGEPMSNYANGDEGHPHPSRHEMLQPRRATDDA